MMGLTLARPKIPFVSTVTGHTETEFDADYWWRNLRAPVLFAQAIGTAITEASPSIYLEISPHPTLIKQVQDCLKRSAASAVVVPSASRKQEYHAFLEAAGRLWSAGAPVDLQQLCPAPAGKIDIPKYPWVRRSLWRETLEMEHYRRADHSSTLLGRCAPSKKLSWHAQIDCRKFPVLSQHRFKSTPLFPASGYLDIAYAAAREVTGNDHCALTNFNIAAGLFLASDEPSIQFMTEYERGSQRLEIFSRVSTNAENWKLNCFTRIGVTRQLESRGAWQRLSEIIAADEGYFHGSVIYRLSEISSLAYGPDLQLVRTGWALPREIVARIEPNASTVQPQHQFDPAIVDACFQPGNMDRDYYVGIDSSHYSFVPVRCGRIEILRPLKQEPVIVYFRKKVVTLKYSIGDLFIFTPVGELIAAFENFESYGLDLMGDKSANNFDRFAYEIVWRPVPA
jgi:acyl transferase domain-containing protein